MATARAWLGTPWIHQGRLKGIGVDCGGLIIGVGRELGLLDFDTQAYGRIPDGQRLRALCDEHLAQKPVNEITPGDVLLMRFTRHPQHLAIAFARGPLGSWDIGSLHGLALEAAVHDPPTAPAEGDHRRSDRLADRPCRRRAVRGPRARAFS